MGQRAGLASPRERLEQALHDLANAVAAARTFAEVLRHRTQPRDTPLVESVLGELDRVGGILRAVRRGAYDEHAAGDVLECLHCGHTFVHRKAPGRTATCRRCRSAEVRRWRPTVD